MARSANSHPAETTSPSLARLRQQLGATSSGRSRPHLPRSVGMRLRASVPVRLVRGRRTLVCRAIEPPTTSVVLEYAGGFTLHGKPAPVHLEFFVEIGAKPLRALARPTRRCSDARYAFKLVAMTDVDRLQLAEFIDSRQAQRRALFALAAPTRHVA